MGASSGTSTIMVALPSMNIPTISTKMLTAIKKAYLFGQTETMNSVSCCGMRSFVSTQENTDAADTMSMMPPVVQTVSLHAWRMPLRLSSL